MPLLYAVKHVVRSWKLFLALLIGVILASTFFAGTDIKANATAKQALDQQLSHVVSDMTAVSNVLDIGRILDADKRISAIEGVTHVEIVSRAQGNVRLGNETEIADVGVSAVGISNDSYVYDGWLNKPTEIGENETYITETSVLASKVKIGDVIQVNFSMYNYLNMTSEVISVNLTVKGFARLDDKAYAIASGYNYYSFTTDNVQIERLDTGILLLDWEKTMQKLYNATNEIDFTSSVISTNLLIYLNHDALINAWDIDTSINNVKNLQLLVENELTLSGIGSNVTNNLESLLNTFRFMSLSLRFAFTIVSIPIFFMAWYMGTTVSNVSFNLRRREIGLLLTKGFSRGQVQRLFLTETVAIGILGGSIGVLLGFVLNPIFSGFSTDSLFNTNLLSPYTLVFTVAFGVIMAVASAYSSAKKASQLATVDALREYLPMEETKAYRKRLVWIAFILGTYKIVVFVLGLNMTTILTRMAFGGGTNFILIILVGLFLILDGILNYIGPLLFFWGFTKLLIVGSTKFQELTAKAAKFMGELGVLATKNVKMNPARSAAIAFLLALIVSYSVQVTGQLASEHDFAVRGIYNNVGADVSLYIPYANEATNISSTIVANLSSSIDSSTLEYSFEAMGTVSNLELKAVQPQSWLKSAYYESGWFSGNDMTTAFEKMASDNRTIILRRSEAELLKLNVNDNVALYFGGNQTVLKIVGFFGPELIQQGQISQSTAYWSYVPEGFYEEISEHVNPSTRMLIKLKAGVDGANTSQNIRDMRLNVSSVQSFDEKWKETQSDVYTVGLLDIQRLGAFFAILAASVGTALVGAVSMKERGREATIMSVRGLSYKQLLIMFLTENLALVMFSVILGLFVGFIALYGNISSSNSYLSDALILHRLVFTSDSALTLASCLGLIFASTILPILIMSRGYVTKLERMVRLR